MSFVKVGWGGTGGRGRGRGWPTLEDGGVLDDETLELRADHLQARLHVTASRHQVALLHLLGAAARPFGLANLQVGAWPAGGDRGASEKFCSRLKLQTRK